MRLKSKHRELDTLFSLFIIEFDKTLESPPSYLVMHDKLEEFFARNPIKSDAEQRELYVQKAKEYGVNIGKILKTMRRKPYHNNQGILTYYDDTEEVFITYQHGQYMTVSVHYEINKDEKR
jgi:hypothetical protein